MDKSTLKTNVQSLTSSVGTALDRFIAEKQNEFPFASGELSQLLRDIVLASKIINRDINRGSLSGIEGSTGEENVQGEKQKMLDVIANIRFTRALIKGGQTCAILSEENEGIIETNNSNAKYLVAIDPLDGSSNIDVNVSVGTIFSIYKRISAIGKPITRNDFLQPGENQIAAGYILYGSSTMLVYTTGYGVNGFTYEPSLGEYFLSHANIKIPEDGNIYSVNESNFETFPEAIKKYIFNCKKRNLSTRYIGSLVADLHRNMFKGGIFLYPTSAVSPMGKLRLMYECNALAFVIEQANGIANDGSTRILSIKPEWYHQRIPFFAGSKKMMAELIG
jgi:fructose-1,6-bisphosphatase I